MFYNLFNTISTELFFCYRGSRDFFRKSIKNKKAALVLKQSSFSEKYFFGYAFQAITEISTFTFFGNVFTATHSRAG